jgi:hypothetical protein
MPHIEEKYLALYLEGRHDKLLKHHLDTEDLVDLVLTTKGRDPQMSLGKSLNAVIRDSCVEAAKKLETGKIKNVWIAEHEDEIKAAGGDSAGAYQAWVTGRIDELTYATEGEVVGAMEERVGVSEENDDDEDDEEDDDE